MSLTETAPNLCAIMGNEHAAQFLAVPGVSLRNLLSSTPAAITHIGKPAAASAAGASSTTEDQLSRGFLYRLPIIQALPPSVQVKGANIVATAIKTAAGADVGRSALGGAVGAEQLEKAKKRLEQLIPMVDFVDEDQKVLDIPLEGGDSVNSNAKHRAGAKSKRQRQIEDLDRKVTAKLNRCANDEERERVARSRDVQSLLAQKDQLMRSVGGGAGSKAQQEAGTRRDRDGHPSAAAASATAAAAVPTEAEAKKEVDDEYGDL